MDLQNLKRLENIGFRIQRVGFFYMPKLLVEWNVNRQQLQYTPSTTRWISFGISMVLNLLVSIGSLYNIVTYLCLTARPDYNVSTLVLHTCAFLVCTAVPLSALLLSRHTYFITGFNQQINFHRNLPQCEIVPEIHFVPHNKIIILGLYAMIGLACCAIMVPFVILFCSLYFRFDPYYFVLQDVFGPFALQKYEIRCFCFLVRFVTVLAGFECSRSGTLGIYCYSYLIGSINIFVSSVSRLHLSIDTKRSLEITRIYIEFLVCLRGILELLMHFNSIIISVGYWAVILLTWAVVKLRSYLAIEVFAMILSLDICSYLLVTFGVVIISKLDVNINEALNRWAIEAKQAYYDAILCSRDVRRQLLNLRKITASLQPVQLEYKPFFVMDHDFMIDISKNLFLRVFDAILIFDI